MSFVIKTMLFLFCAGVISNAQTSGWNSGDPAIRNFTPKEYGAHSQNWAIVQDRRGVIYVGNTGGALEYDGVSWRLIVPKEGNKVVFSLAIDKNNRIYYGSYNELGYLSPDSAGQLQFVSLLEKLPKKYRKCLNVWSTHASQNGVYFTTPKYVFLYRNDKFIIWESSTRFRNSFLVNQQFFVYKEKVGLMKHAGDSLALFVKAKTLNNKIVLFIVPYSKERFLLGTAGGFYLLSKSGIASRTVEPLIINDFERKLIEKSKLSGGLALSDNIVAVPSYESGLLIFNKQGDLLQTLDKSRGLSDQKIMFAFADNQSGLWLATNNGISRIEIPSPLSFFDGRSGEVGNALKILKHGNSIFAGTSNGIFYYDENEKSPKFQKVNGVNFVCWDLLSFGDLLLAATEKGVFEITKGADTPKKIFDQYAFCMTRSETDSSRVFLGLKNGAASIYYRKKYGWINEGKPGGFNERVRFIADDRNGDLWLCTSYNGVWNASFSKEAENKKKNIWDDAEITKYDTADGLPSLKKNRAFSIGKDIVFSGIHGVYGFNAEKKKFVEMKEYQLSPFNRDWNVFRIAGNNLNNLWMAIAGDYFEVGVSRLSSVDEGGWKSYTYKRFFDSQINAILPEKNGVLWFGGTSGIAKYDAGIKKNYSADFNALIRRVIVNGDSSVYAGAAGVSDKLSVFKKTAPVLNYDDNSLRFEYAAVSFDASETNRFQYFLEGFDNGWSEWTNETKKDYTNIPEGKYSFRIRAKNVYSKVSLEDAFPFEILPPFYRTVWAYVAYALFFGFLFIAGVNWRARKHIKDKRALENLIAERTKEVKEQAEKLKEMDKLKSRFFANISHEFRTPLTLIIDPVEQMMTGAFKGDLKTQYGIINKNARKLLGLINQLLCLSKLESGAMKLNAGRGNVIPLIKGIANSFESSARSKKIELEFSFKEGVVEFNFDAGKFEQILVNLISNALKFTPSGGKVSVSAEACDNNSIERSEFQSEEYLKTQKKIVRISVKDTGAGIPPEERENIFDRFFQADGSHTRKHEGTGIGLALTKELVELHRGTISVKSGVNEGSEFIVLLPTDLPATVNNAEQKIGDIASMEIFDAEIEIEYEEEPQLIEKIKLDEDVPKVLIVEDNADVRNYIKLYLENDYEIIEAINGAEGIDAAVREIPDLIISDVMMPETDGYELCRNLKSDVRTSHIPIILLTAKAEDADKITGLNTGADDYLIKPFNSDILLTRINNLIELRKKLREKYKEEFFLFAESADFKSDALSLDEKFLLNAHKIVENKISEADFSVDDFAKTIFMSRVNLYRKLKSLINQTPSEFMRTIRLKRAAALLKQNAGNITEITFQVGFTSTAYFSKCFREQFGLTPSEFMKKER